MLGVGVRGGEKKLKKQQRKLGIGAFVLHLGQCDGGGDTKLTSYPTDVSFD